MPTALLYIRLLKEQGFHYGVPNELKEAYSSTFDIDNFSDTEVVTSAVNFLKQENVKIILEVEPLAPLNKLLHLFNSIRDLDNPDLDVIGEHRMIAYLRNK